MDYLDDAPPFPQHHQHGSTNPNQPRPYIYNYAQRKTQPNSLHQMPQQRTLPEDNTAEVMNPDTENKHNPNTVMIVSFITIFILIMIVSGIGLYFALKPSKSAKDAKKPTNSSNTDTISIIGLLMIDKDNQNEFNYMSDPFPFNTLHSFEGISDLFQNKKWIHHKPNLGQTEDNGLCQYFEQSSKHFSSQSTSGFVECCGKFKLYESEEHSSCFIILSENQLGVVLELNVIIFKYLQDQNKSYYVTSNQINNYNSNSQRRRLMQTHIMSEESLIQIKNQWKELPPDVDPRQVTPKLLNRENEISVQKPDVSQETVHHELHLTTSHHNAQTDHDEHSPHQTIDFTLTPVEHEHEHGHDGQYRTHIAPAPHQEQNRPRVHYRTQTLTQTEKLDANCDQSKIDTLFIQSISFNVVNLIEGRVYKCQYSRALRQKSTITFHTMYWDDLLTKKICNTHRHPLSICEKLPKQTKQIDDNYDQDSYYFPACKVLWKVINRESESLLQYTVKEDRRTISIDNIKTIIREQNSANRETEEIHGVPFYSCSLILLDKHQIPEHEGGNPDGGLSEREKRRRLESEQNNSSNNNNLMFIFVTTFVCVLVGVQSFYILSVHP